MNTKTLLLIEDSFLDFDKIRNLISDEWDVLPKINNEEELNLFLYGEETISFTDRKSSTSCIKKHITEYILNDEKFKYISTIILDIKLSDIPDQNNLEEGYFVLDALRNLSIDNFRYKGWNKIVPIIILSRYKDKVRMALSRKAITNLCLTKDEIEKDSEVLLDYVNHLFNYFEIVQDNMFHYNSLCDNFNELDDKIDQSLLRFNYLLDSLQEIKEETNILLNAVFKKLKPSEREQLIDKFNEKLTPQLKHDFEVTYFEKLKENMKKNVDDVDLFVKTFEYAPVTIFTTLRDVVMNIGLYKWKK